MRKQPRKRILVVSADVRVRAPLFRLLNAAGYDVAVAACPVEACEPIQQHAVDIVVVVTIGRAPEGLVLLEALQQTRQKIPVILVSDVNDVELYLEAMNRGAFEYLVQPLSEAELLTVVAKALERCPRRCRAA